MLTRRARLTVLATVGLTVAAAGTVGIVLLNRADPPVPSAPSIPTDGPAPDGGPSLRMAARSGLEVARHRASDRDPRFFDGQVWYTGNDRCLRCDVGPGVTAAALAAAGDDPELTAVAVRTMDAVVEHNQLPDGAFNLPGARSPADIETCFFASHLGLTLWALGSELDQKRRDAWTSVLRDATDFLRDNGNYRWYTNGNIVLCNALTAALTWQATGEARYETVYRQALAFAERPPAGRWAGRGLVLTRAPGRADGSDGAGYLTESAGDRTPGLDPDYVQVQADLAAITALVTGDAAALRLTNLLVNELLPRVDRVAWRLDTSGGSRHPEAARSVPFTTCAVAVLAILGRSDLAALVPAQTGAMVRQITEDSAVGAYQLWGSRLAPALIALS